MSPYFQHRDVYVSVFKRLDLIEKVLVEHKIKEIGKEIF